MHYPGVAKTNFPPAAQIPWARVTLQHVSGTHSAFGGDGQNRFTHTGILTVQIFTPIGKGGRDAYTLAQTVVEAFQGGETLNGVRFRNVASNEIGVDDDWFQINVVINFEYDQLTTPTPAAEAGGTGSPITLDPIV